MISSRHTWACYLISKSTGKIIWTLDGGGNTTEFGGLEEEAQFRWQHDARVQNITHGSIVLSIFDNHSTKQDKGTGPTQGLMLELGLPPNPTKSPRILRKVMTDGTPLVDSQGSYQSNLENGNQLLSYGPLSLIQEFGPSSDGSDLRWEGRFGHDFKSQSYRAFKGKWSATPADWNPSLVVEADAPGCNKQGHEGCLRAYVSWNGATEVKWWGVYCGSRAKTRIFGGSGVHLIGKAYKKGFETVFEVPTSGANTCLQVGAMQSKTEVRRSNIACP